MDDKWIISWFNHTAFDANPMWKSPIWAALQPLLIVDGPAWAEISSD